MNHDDVQSCIVTVDSRQGDVDSLSTELFPPLEVVMTSAVNCLRECLSAARLTSCQRVAGLKAFVHVGCFAAADLLQG